MFFLAQDMVKLYLSEHESYISVCQDNRATNIIMAPWDESVVPFQVQVKYNQVMSSRDFMVNSVKETSINSCSTFN